MAIVSSDYYQFLFAFLTLCWTLRTAHSLKCPQLAGGSAHATSVNKLLNNLAVDKAYDVDVSTKDDNGKPVRYLYKISLCQSESDVAVDQEDLGAEGKSIAAGKFDDVQVVGGSNWLIVTYFGDRYGHHCNKSKRRTVFFIQCDSSADTKEKRTPKYGLEYAPKGKDTENCYYLFEMKHNGVCPPTKRKISPGSVFLIIIIVVGVLYLVLGLLYQRFIVGAKGLEQIPNYLMWREFGSLQADGCNFICRSKSPREPTRYKPMDDAIADDDDDVDSEKDDTLLPM